MTIRAGLLHDERGALSSKRVAGLAAAFTLMLIALAQVFLPALLHALDKQTPPSLAVDDTIASALMWICLGGLGLASVDKFSPQAKVNAELHKARESKAIAAVPEGTA